MSVQPSPGVVVRPTRPADLPVVVRWHLRHLPHGLFPMLGERFMRRWHATFLDAPHGVSLLAELTGTDRPVQVGFLVGATDQPAHVADVIRRHRVPLGLSGVAALLLRPAVAAHFVRTRAGAYLRRLLRPQPSPGPPATGGAATDQAGPARRIAVVTAVVVDPTARGTGIGATLLKRFVEHARAADATEVQLTTLSGEAGAGGFYQILGWEHVGDKQTRDGAPMSTYRLDLLGRAAVPDQHRASQHRASQHRGGARTSSVHPDGTR